MTMAENVPVRMHSSADLRKNNVHPHERVPFHPHPLAFVRNSGYDLRMMTMRQFLILTATGAVFAAAYAVRFLWVEDSALGFACAADMTAACAVRQAFIVGFHLKVFGIAAVALGGLALVMRTGATAALALAASALALVFYNTDLGSFAAVLGLIALARLRGGRAGRLAAG
jgi:hypothetical protein